MSHQRLNEYDVVELVSSKEGFTPGLRGVVLLVLGNDQEAFEVEFFDQDGVSLGTATIEQSDLKLIEKPGRK